ncbi:putative signaling protein [Mixta intestinalis]|uniref:diguanylate cyclase n=2 Tax=Mixta intestinalis TaxID=1615494 RepID=A0A6P1PVL4_9GAMM|nr:putative signaling protein [Mixta intestinalis]
MPQRARRATAEVIQRILIRVSQMNLPTLLPFNLRPADAPATFFTRRTLLVLGMMLAAVLFTTAMTIVAIAVRQNGAALAQEKFLVRNAWQARQKSILTDIRDYAFWGEAWNHLHLQVDKAWAFDQQNLGPGLYSEYHYEGVFVVDGSGRTRYAVINGKLSTMQLEHWLGKASVEIVQQARTFLQDENALVRNASIAGTPAIVAAAPITTGKVPGLSITADPPSVMVFVDRYTPQKMLALGKSVGVSQLHTVSAQGPSVIPASLTLLGDRDEPLRLGWESSEPGHHLLVIMIPLMALTMLMLGMVSRRVVRHAMDNARLSDWRFEQLRQSQRELGDSEARFRDVAEAASDWIWETDAYGVLTYLSSRFTAVTGYDVAVQLGKPIDCLLLSKGQPVSEWMLRLGTGGDRRTLRCHYHSAQGEERICSLVAKPVALQDGLIGFRGTVSDITLEVEAQARIQYLSQHDTLTGLPNRHRMNEFLSGKLQAQPTEAEPLVMFSLDLDHFKPINDLYGHAAGDSVLNEVSQRLRVCLKAGDLLSRQGGDEFILLLSGLTSQQAIEARCRSLMQEIHKPFNVAGQRVHIGASVGIARAPQDALQPEELLRMADIALYQSKNLGRDRWVFYSPEMSEQLVRRREMERALGQAVARDELRLFYQPRYSLHSGRMDGAEALLRWQPSPPALVMPDSFIPLAEETGLILPISDWVLQRACRDALSWPEKFYVSVNISPVEFCRGDLAGRVASVLQLTGLPAERLELEITENVTLENPDNTLKVMQSLKRLGVRLTVDDFGSGYASLGYLKTFPFDGLKMDRSYMKDFPHSQQAHSIVNGIIGLGKAFSLVITAEGIENAEQFAELQAIACDEGQGYFLGRPMPGGDFARLLHGTEEDENQKETGQPG